MKELFKELKCWLADVLISWAFSLDPKRFEGHSAIPIPLRGKWDGWAQEEEPKHKPEIPEARRLELYSELTKLYNQKSKAIIALNKFVKLNNSQYKGITCAYNLRGVSPSHIFILARPKLSTDDIGEGRGCGAVIKIDYEGNLID